MSQKVFPPMAFTGDELHKPRTLHLVMRGSDRCVICGQTKYRMAYHYTDEPEVFALMVYNSNGDPFGMWSPSDEMMMPYYACGQLQPPEGKPAADSMMLPAYGRIQ